MNAQRDELRVQIMACTADEDAVGYLNDIDERFRNVDVTDDYYSEMLEVIKKARTRSQFTRGDWLMKAMLGPISAKFDAWDETGKKQAGVSASTLMLKDQQMPRACPKKTQEETP
ncbi:Uncharacterized protein SCF082_LOCUS44553 [Durusdinium trenchii]|uniref:Uncharacterized protein n=1 Tax=Durusdinium trenchii TaxID=1381693 RepID=A0ABP0R2K9_9DINO